MQDDERVTYFAQTDSRNRRVNFGIKAKDRSRHMYVIGKTGMGKSTLLENLAIQDLKNGEGMAFVDPHGKSAQTLLDYVPKERMHDVLYFAPFDIDYPVGFNVMEDVNPDRRHLVVNGLMSTFEKIWEDAWSARMSYILQNTIHALLEYPGATLLDVNRMYTNKSFREKVVENIEDTSVRSFWKDEYANYSDRYTQDATPAIQNKVGQLAANPVIRNILGQRRSSFDIREMMDNRKILIVNLSKGKVGEANANLLGALMINKVYLGAMSRADASDEELAQMPNFYTHVDEFQSFANRSFADILSESRKYKLNLTMAHQYIEQMSEEVRAAVFGNVGTMVTFRVGAYDAEILEKEFQPTFTQEDIVNLDFAQIYLKLMIDGVTSPPFSAVTLPPITTEDISYREEIVTASRRQFARPREEVEHDIKAWQEQHSETASQGGGQQSSSKGGGAGTGKQKQQRSSSDKSGSAAKKGGPKSGGGAGKGKQKDATSADQKDTEPGALRSVLAQLSRKQNTAQGTPTPKSGGNAQAESDTVADTARTKHKGSSQDKDSTSSGNPLKEALQQQGLFGHRSQERPAQRKQDVDRDNSSGPQNTKKRSSNKATNTVKSGARNDRLRADAGSDMHGRETETARNTKTGQTSDQAGRTSRGSAGASADTGNQERYESPGQQEVPPDVLSDLLSMDEEYSEETGTFRQRQQERDRS